MVPYFIFKAFNCRSTSRRLRQTNYSLSEVSHFGIATSFTIEMYCSVTRPAGVLPSLNHLLNRFAICFMINSFMSRQVHIAHPALNVLCNCLVHRRHLSSSQSLVPALTPCLRVVCEDGHKSEAVQSDADREERALGVSWCPFYLPVFRLSWIKVIRWRRIRWYIVQSLTNRIRPKG